MDSTAYRSILFKYKQNLYLGFFNDGEIINEFKPIKYTDNTFSEMKENELCVVLVEKNGKTFKIHSLESVPLYEEENYKAIVIGDMEQDDMFFAVNQVLETSKRKKLH